MDIALVHTQNGENIAQVVKNAYQGEQNVVWVDWEPDYFVDCLSQPDVLSSVDAVIFVLANADVDQQRVEEVDEYAEKRAANSFIWLKQKGVKHCPKHGKVIEESNPEWLILLKACLKELHPTNLLENGKIMSKEETIPKIEIERIVDQRISTFRFATDDGVANLIAEAKASIQTQIDQIKPQILQIDGFQNIEKYIKPQVRCSPILLAIAGVLLYAMIVYDKLMNPNKMNLGITITIAVCGTVLLMSAVYLYVTTRKHYFRVLSERRDDLICIDIISRIDDVAVRNALYERLIGAKLKNRTEDL